MLNVKYILSILTLSILGLAPNAAAQRVVALRIDSTHCVGDSLRFSVGYDTARDVVIENPPLSISHPQRTFLPDGKVCDSTLGTCTYRSPLTFTAFDLGSIVTSVQQIDYVRLNIEHSWIGDLKIALECPNGQFAALIQSRNDSILDCGEEKFDTLTGWDLGSETANPGAFLGDAIKLSNANNCDTSIYENRPGIGFNYCWSENTSHQYAPQDGLLYRIANVIILNSPSHHQAIDSTHILENSQYYHPQQSFDALIGCPLSGTWNIVVQDNWGGDNGWIFDWELAFDPALYVPPHITSVTLDDGNGIIVHDNDTIYTVAPPTIDTTINYSMQVVLSCGDTIDTTFSIHWLEPFFYSETDTLCQGDTARWTCLEFTTDTLHQIRTTRINGCDSTVDLSYTFMPSYSLHDTLPYCANEQFLYEGVDYGGPCTIVVPHQTQYGCDSTVTAHLVVIDSAFHLQLQMSADSVVWSTDTVLYGCQPMTVWLRDTTLFEQWRLWTFGNGDTLLQEISAFQEATPFTYTYDSVGIYSLTLTAESIHGCVDSAVFRRAAVHVYPSPEADFFWTPSEIVNHDPWTQFVNLSHPIDSLSFLWNIPTGDGGTDTTSAIAPYYQWPVGSSDVEVSLNAIWLHPINDSITLECFDSAVHTVIITNEYLQFPNLVTPNGDGINDRWEIANLLECGLYSMNELWIFNRWGVLVYHVKNIRHPEDFWNPTPYPDGTYYYRFSAKSKYGLVKRNGTIEVIR